MQAVRYVGTFDLVPCPVTGDSGADGCRRYLRLVALASLVCYALHLLIVLLGGV